MPINVTLSTFSFVDFSSRAQRRTCSTISLAVRLRVRPKRPVAQKEDLRGQPTWQETQTALRVALAGARVSAGPELFINTVSILLPSSNVIKAFDESVSVLISALMPSGQNFFSSSRRGLGKFETSSQFFIKSLNMAFLACLSRNDGSALSAFSRFSKFMFSVIKLAHDILSA